ncbi:hypothetical protein TNCV_3067731 [Trichonephila clavipes]|nr:hypothetical protein TNCV_3067731 [Trichonephila clavipes]
MLKAFFLWSLCTLNFPTDTPYTLATTAIAGIKGQPFRECEGYNFDKLKLLIDNEWFRSIPTSLWPPPAKKSAPCACSEPWVHFREKTLLNKSGMHCHFWLQSCL